MSQARTAIRLPGAAARPRQRSAPEIGEPVASALTAPTIAIDPALPPSSPELPAAEAAAASDAQGSSADVARRVRPPGGKRARTTEETELKASDAAVGPKMALEVLDLGHARKQQANVYLPDVVHDHYDQLVRDLKHVLPRRTSISEVYTALLSEGPGTAEDLLEVVLRHRARQDQVR